jgi:hypothetical protein
MGLTRINHQFLRVEHVLAKFWYFKTDSLTIKYGGSSIKHIHMINGIDHKLWVGLTYLKHQNSSDIQLIYDVWLMVRGLYMFRLPYMGRESQREAERKSRKREREREKRPFTKGIAPSLLGISINQPATWQRVKLSKGRSKAGHVVQKISSCCSKVMSQF